MGKNIGVISLKGGVGKTSSVVALGAALANLNKKVLLVDGNLSSPNLGLHLNIVDPEFTLHDVLSRTANISDAIHRYENFDVIPSSVFTNKKVNPLKLKDNLSFLKRKYDVILMDSSPSLDAETLGVMLASDIVFVVTTPDHPTLSNTLKAVKLAKQRGTPVGGLILNKVHKKNFEIPLEEIEKISEVPVLAVIPHDVRNLKALSELIPSTMYNPYSKGSKEYRKLASSIIGEKYKQTKLKDFWKKVKPKKQDINRDLFYNRVFE